MISSCSFCSLIEPKIKVFFFRLAHSSIPHIAFSIIFGTMNFDPMQWMSCVVLQILYYIYCIPNRYSVTYTYCIFIRIHVDIYFISWFSVSHRHFAVFILHSTEIRIKLYGWCRVGLPFSLSLLLFLFLF